VILKEIYTHCKAIAPFENENATIQSCTTTLKHGECRKRNETNSIKYLKAIEISVDKISHKLTKKNKRHSETLRHYDDMPL